MSRLLPTQNISLLLLIMFSGLSLCALNPYKLTKDTLKHSKSGWRQDLHVISIGIGLKNYDVERFQGALGRTNTYTISNLTGSIPLHAKFEFFLRKHIGFGTTLNYDNFNYDYTTNSLVNNQTVPQTYRLTSNVFTINLRLNYHFFYHKAVDVYLGVGTGLRIVRAPSGSINFYNFYPDGFFREYELSVGIRYLAWGIIGLYAEAGYGRSPFQAGVSCNIKGF